MINQSSNIRRPKLTQDALQSSLNAQTLIIVLATSAYMTGCFVAIDDSSYDDDYYEDTYYEDGYYEDTYYEDVYNEETYDELADEVIEEERVEEEILEETTTTTTTTINDDSTADDGVSEPSVETIPIGPVQVDPIFEERFERPGLLDGEYIALTQMGQWMIEWMPGSRCDGISGTATALIQSGLDLGAQVEIEGRQHARLDGACGSEINPTKITTSLEDVYSARMLTLFARSADGVIDAELQVEWGDQVVMRETLRNGWAHYRIDLTQMRRDSEATLTLSALTPGVIIDHILVE